MNSGAIWRIKPGSKMCSMSLNVQPTLTCILIFACISNYTGWKRLHDIEKIARNFDSASPYGLCKSLIRFRAFWRWVDNRARLICWFRTRNTVIVWSFEIAQFTEFLWCFFLTMSTLSYFGYDDIEFYCWIQ